MSKALRASNLLARHLDGSDGSEPVQDWPDRMAPILTEADYRAALKQAEAFFDAPNEPDPDSEDGVYFEALITLIEAYETKHFPILDAAKADFNEGCLIGSLRSDP